MLSSLALLISLATPAPVPTPAVCHLVEPQLINIPPGDQQHSTEIVHAAAVTNGEDLVGFLYILRNGELWYQNGLVGMGGTFGLHIGDEAEKLQALTIVAPQLAKARPLGLLYPGKQPRGGAHALDGRLLNSQLLLNLRAAAPHCKKDLAQVGLRRAPCRSSLNPQVRRPLQGAGCGKPRLSSGYLTRAFQ